MREHRWRCQQPVALASGRESPGVDGGQDPGTTTGGVLLLPTMEYVHPALVEGRVSVGAFDIGAYELGGGAPDLALQGGVDAGDVRRRRLARGGCDVGTRPGLAPAAFWFALLLPAFRALTK